MAHQKVVLLTFDMEGLYGNASEQTKVILDELKKYHAYGTFFFTASYAQRSSEIVEEILDGGHEVGCHGLDHYTLTLLEQSEVKERLEKASSMLSHLSKTSAQGFRAPNFAVNPALLDIVEKLGFKYDSSILPSVPIPSWYGSANAPIYPYRPNLTRLGAEDENYEFWEVPLAVFPRIRLPCFGGWWLRNLGETWFRSGLGLLLRGGPATVCLHDWEFLQPQSIELQSKHESEHPFPPLTFRNTGAYVARALRHLLRSYRSRIFSIDMAIEKDLLRK